LRERVAARPTIKQHLTAIRVLFDWLTLDDVERITIQRLPGSLLSPCVHMDRVEARRLVKSVIKNKAERAAVGPIHSSCRTYVDLLFSRYSKAGL